ncbi:glucokinase [Gloeobacter morelensis]|uniref:Glucokinase n=1 Tax=Gloeobacter morelensis MG652769 TaxID=2781736 RepID=A0ABY3PMJ2_9CYAN|nr:glucokinase [Gloeobacter morelensis]UFP94922.1 glucokinase [Gloeobacter morelensis MG652769]
MILAGDVGGTNTRLAGFEPVAGNLMPIVAETYASRDHSSLDTIVYLFISEYRLRVAAACFGVAGPVRRGRAETTNLPWSIDANALAAGLKLPTVGLINDLEANAHGIALLGPADFAVLNPGAADAMGNQAVIAAGTGLGEAGLFWDGRRHRPFATEGGHSDFAPGDALQIELLRHLRVRFAHVSWERVLSGPGLVNLYQFLRDTGRGEEPDWLTEELRNHPNPAAVISQAALAGKSWLCEQALDLLIVLYGAEAGNLALKVTALGGVFLGGGIAPKLVDRLKGPAFLEAFFSKGRLRPLLEAMPVRVILNERAALLGAAHCAMQTLI